MLITRTRPVAPVVQAQKPTARRMVFARSKVDVASILASAAGKIPRTTSVDSAASREATAARAKVVIETNLKLISEAERKIDEATLEITQAYKIVEAQLKLAGLDAHSNGVLVASLVEKWTRQSRTIDPKKFRNKVANEVFWSSISVNLTKAGEHLTDKELTDMSDVVPGKSQGFSLEIKPVKVKRRTGK